MPAVYVTPSNPYRRRFHASPECVQLTKAPATGRPQEILKIEVDELAVALPCRTCYPDAPVATSAHRYCRVCDSGKVRPCAHNGGVLVHMTRTHRKGSLYRDPGEVFTQARWVWPERANKYLAS